MEAFTPIGKLSAHDYNRGHRSAAATSFDHRPPRDDRHAPLPGLRLKQPASRRQDELTA